MILLSCYLDMILLFLPYSFGREFSGFSNRNVYVTSHVVAPQQGDNWTSYCARILPAAKTCGIAHILPAAKTCGIKQHWQAFCPCPRSKYRYQLSSWADTGQAGNCSRSSSFFSVTGKALRHTAPNTKAAPILHVKNGLHCQRSYLDRQIYGSLKSSCLLDLAVRLIWPCHRWHKRTRTPSLPHSHTHTHTHIHTHTLTTTHTHTHTHTHTQPHQHIHKPTSTPMLLRHKSPRCHLVDSPVCICKYVCVA